MDIDDGIELNFASPDAGPSTGVPSGIKGKVKGNWVHKLKANKAAKRRSEKGPSTAPARSPVAIAPEQKAAAQAVLANYSATKRAAVTPKPNGAANTHWNTSSASQNRNDPKAKGKAREEVASEAAEKIIIANKSSGNDDLDLTALARKAIEIGKRPAHTEPSNSTTPSRPVRDSQPSSSRVQNGSVLSGEQPKQVSSSSRSDSTRVQTATSQIAKRTAPKPSARATEDDGALPPLAIPKRDDYGTAESAGDSLHGVGGFQIISSLFSSLPTSLKTGDEDGEGDLEAKSGAQPSNAPSDASSFEGLGLDPLIINHLKSKLGIERPTRIQRSVLAGLLDPTPLTIGKEPGDFDLSAHIDIDGRRRDAFIQSQTGSGKTLSFLLPILQSLLPLASKKGFYVDRSVGTLAIILAPTRELARQIETVLESLLHMSLALPEYLQRPEADGEDDEARRRAFYKRYLVSAVLTGGATRNHEKTRLRRGCPILVCTPGRLLDHLQNTQSFQCDKLMWLVLDEADRLIEEGFGETLAGIMKALEGRRKIGHEADLAAQRSGNQNRVKSTAKPKHTKDFGAVNGHDEAVKPPAWLDGDSSDEDDDEDHWDYETMGPRPKKRKTDESDSALKQQSGAEDQILAGRTAWPYWHLGRRNILCSATISGEVQKLAHVALRDPVMYRGGDAKDEEEPPLKDLSQTMPTKSGPSTTAVAVKGEDEKFTPPSQLDQRYVVVPLKLRLVTLVALMRSLIAKATAAAAADPQNAGAGTKIIAFLSSTDSVDYHWKLFGGVKMGSGATVASESDDTSEPVSFTCPLFPSTQIMRLHGSLPLQTRRASLAAFAAASVKKDNASSRHSILLCTSVASRGLDLPLVRAVVQYDLPTEQGVNEYVHRVGRTARVGRGGESWAFVGDSEVDWVPWVESGMSESGKQDVKLRQVGVEDVLRRGFGAKGAHKASREFEQRATQVQLAFERWVVDSEENLALARRAFSSHVRAYSTHPHEEKRFFHVRNLHLGHLAKAFGLREAPGKIGSASSVPKVPKGKVIPGSNSGQPTHSHTSRSKTAHGSAQDAGLANDEDDEDDEDEDDMGGAGAGALEMELGPRVAKYVPTTETEKRMTAAVRRAGRLVKAGGKFGMGSQPTSTGRGYGNNRQSNSGGSGGGGGGGEYQVAGTAELESLVKRSLSSSGGQKNQKKRKR